MSYRIKEIYRSLQGEGFHSGRAAVICRFSGCNLWSGREEDRAGAVCRFCDTDFRGTDGVLGGDYECAQALVEAVRDAWECGEEQGEVRGQPMVVLTGGEPLLQVDGALIDAFRGAGFYSSLETNGTRPVPQGKAGGIDWVTVSPKAGAELVLNEGDELKLVYPQDLAPESFESLDFDHFYLQPMDGPERDLNTALAAAYCEANPRWKLSIQTHKLLGVR